MDFGGLERKDLTLKERFPTVPDRHLEDALTKYKGHAGRAAGHIQKMYASGDITTGSVVAEEVDDLTAVVTSTRAAESTDL